MSDLSDKQWNSKYSVDCPVLVEREPRGVVHARARGSAYLDSNGQVKLPVKIYQPGAVPYLEKVPLRKVHEDMSDEERFPNLTKLISAWPWCGCMGNDSVALAIFTYLFSLDENRQNTTLYLKIPYDSNDAMIEAISYTFLGLFEQLEVTEHGTSIRHSFLTEFGTKCAAEANLWLELYGTVHDVFDSLFK